MNEPETTLPSMAELAEIVAAVLAAPKNSMFNGHLWWCGDYVCDCVKAEIEVRRPHPRYGGWAVVDVIWEGEFYSDHQYAPAKAELRRMSELIKAERPAAWRRIAWKDFVDAGW